MNELELIRIWIYSIGGTLTFTCALLVFSQRHISNILRLLFSGVLFCFGFVLFSNVGHLRNGDDESFIYMNIAGIVIEVALAIWLTCYLLKKNKKNRKLHHRYDAN